MDNTPAPRSYQRGRWHTLENSVMSALVTAGLIPHCYLLTTVGRSTGRPRSNPVTIVLLQGRRWLVAPYGAVPWVLNARAAGDVTLARRGRAQRFTIRAATAEEAGPVLQRYVAIAAATRSYFRAPPGAPADDFAAEADQHPVFELLPFRRPDAA